MKRFLSWITLATITAGLLSGCGSKPVETPKEIKAPTGVEEKKEGEPVAFDPNMPQWKQNADNKVKLDWYIHFSWFSRKWGSDMTSRYITEKTGVDVDYVIPAGNEAEKLNTMIASGSLPDLITLGWYEGQVKQIIDAGLVYSLDELANEYCPEFFDVADQDKLNWYKMEDGYTYGYPNASYSPSDFVKYADTNVSNQTFLVRKDIYEAIGSPDMTTPEGFIEALKKAKEMYPTINNQPIIPFGLHEFGDNGNDSLEGYLQNFLAIPYEDNGEIYDRTTDPEYITWLKTIRLANEEGLLAKDIFIDKRAQMEEKIAQGRYFSMLYQSQDMIAPNSKLYTEDPNSCYISVDGPKNSKGDDYTLNGGTISGWTLTMVSKNCKDPQKAIEFITYMISEEGQHDIKLGTEELWTTIEGRDVLKDEYLAIKDTDSEKWDNEFGADNSHWMLMDTPMQEQWSTPMTEPLKQTKEWTKPYVQYISMYEGIDPEPDTEEDVNLKKIKAKWGSTLPKLILAENDDEFDKIFNEFLEYRDANGFAEINKIRTQKMNINKEKLGM